MRAQPESGSKLDLLQGTLDMLILHTLRAGPKHGKGIMHSIRLHSEEALLLNHGSLYPALQRLQRRGWVTAKWGTSENNQRAKYHTVTDSGLEQLSCETAKWDRFCQAMALVMNSAEEG